MNYNVKELSRNVHSIKMNYKSGWEQWFLLSSDQHRDHPDCNQKLLTKHMDQAVEKDAGIMVFGDWVCGMQTKFDKRGNKSSLKAEHAHNNYLDALVESESDYMGKYAKNMVLYSPGNHEASILRRNETEIVSRIVERTKLKYKAKDFYKGGYGGYIKFMFEQAGSKGGRSSIILKYRHSGGSLGEITKGTLGVDRMSKAFPDADIIVTGDNHEKWMMSVMQEKLNNSGKIQHKSQLHIKLPTYKDEYKDGFSGWHVERDAPPKPLGAAWLRFFYEEGQIKYEVIWTN
jgi:hypothetical protein